jgi:hypothetical protein
MGVEVWVHKMQKHAHMQTCHCVATRKMSERLVVPASLLVVCRLSRPQTPIIISSSPHQQQQQPQPPAGPVHCIPWAAGAAAAARGAAV